MSETTPSIEQARDAYIALKGHYSADVIQRRLGLGNSRNKLETILSSPVRRVKLVNWWSYVVRESQR